MASLPPLPPSVKELAEDAEGFEFNTSTPFRSWLRAADAINRQAHAYVRDGDDQNSYIFLLRHAILVFERLESYPESNTSLELTAARLLAQSNVGLLEEIKPRIEARHKRFQDILIQHQEILKQRKVDVSDHSIQNASFGAVIDQYQESGRKVVDPAKHHALALSLARKQIPFRPESEVIRSGGWQVADDLRHMSLINSHSAQASQTNAISLPTELVHSHHSNLNYPSIPRAAPAHSSTSKAQLNTLSSVNSLRVAPPPPTPPKTIITQQDQNSRSSHRSTISDPHFSLQHSTRISNVDAGSESTASEYTFKATAFTENGNPLRTLFLPPNIHKEFVRIAFPNTKRNLETCGILCGKLISNALFISRLVIPDQVSTSDTCDTVNEGALFDYCDSNDLLTIGWIHTHPTQTCFMSSRDLHTHSGYQVQMPESIAIVCSPSQDPSWGVFRLTDPPGLRTVLNCTQTGLFHPHSSEDLYLNTTQNGHVRILEGLQFQVVDLRPSLG